MYFRRFAISAIAFLLSSHSQAEEISGHWVGAMVTQGQSLPVSFDFKQAALGPEGRFTSETQAAMDYPLDKVTVNLAHLSFTLGGSITFDAAIRGGVISGTFKNGETPGKFTLRRATLPSLPYNIEDVSFQNGNVTLQGTLCLPHTGGRHAAVVLLHGSGPESRWGTSRYIADRFARAGIAALIYDKRGSGNSGGDWRTASYFDLAGDALAAITFLASRADIDPANIGLYGHSQGGVIAPLAATLAPKRVAFIVAEDTFAGSQREQDIYRVQNALHELSLSPADYSKAMKIYALFVDSARGTRPYADFEKQSAPYRDTNWYKWMDFPPRDSWIWPWALKNGSFDTMPVWRKVREPVLLVYGEKDALVPVDDSIASIGAALDASGTRYAAFIVPNAQHNLTIQPEPARPFFWWHQAPGVIDTVVAWVMSQTRAVGEAK